MPDHDVIVVGAGFGGPVAARKCALAGLRTVILERGIAVGRIDTEESLKLPKPLAPVLAFSHNAYCLDSCEWEADMAVRAGAELRTGCVAVDVVMEDGVVASADPVEFLEAGPLEAAYRVSVERAGARG